MIFRYGSNSCLSISISIFFLTNIDTDMDISRILKFFSYLNYFKYENKSKWILSIPFLPLIISLKYLLCIETQFSLTPSNYIFLGFQASSLVAGTVAQPISEKLESSTPPKYRDQLLNEYIKLKSYVPLPNTFEQWLDVEVESLNLFS